MTSKLGNRMLTAAIIAIIVALVILIIVLWTGRASEPQATTTARSRPTQVTDSELDALQNRVRLKTKRPPVTAPPQSAPDDRPEGPGGFQVQYVRPVKIFPPPIHEQDILYGGDEWAFPQPVTSSEEGDSPKLRHHSGHFRHKTALVWDPHPEYEFSAFGHRFRLELRLDSGFVSPDLKVQHLWKNSTKRVAPSLRPGGCFYTGKVKGDARSVVAVSLCHGMTGHIRTSSGSFFIEPAEEWKNHSTPILHSLYRLPSPGQPEGKGGAGSHCGLDDDARTKEERVYAWNATSFRVGPREQDVSSRSNRSRRKRSLSQEYYVEVMVVTDRKMSEYHGENLDHYVLTLMSIVAQIYKDATIGNPVTVAVVKLLNLKDQGFAFQRDPEGGTSAADMLKNFCKWQQGGKVPDGRYREHYDTALLLTRENICRVPAHQKCDTLGLAELGTMCDRDSSCSIVQDNGLSAAFTIAHELGHVLNMPHDDDFKCLTFHGSSRVHNVMSRMLDHNTYPWSWSNCSRHYLTEYLDAGYGNCLLDKPDIFVTDKARRSHLPGELFNEDKQCELVFGHGSRICSYMPACKRLWCTTDVGEQEGCRTQHMPWADGTPCSDGMWCQRGHCVMRDLASLRPIDGNWGEWQGWGECSRTCGGGVKRSLRECNSPFPSNGGQYCIGRRVKFRSCKIQECPSGTRDFREEQCAVYNNNNFNIQGLSHDVKWVPKYGGINPDDRCKLFCRVAQSSAYYLLKEKVLDGTPCGPDTYDICVNGMCRPAGCNHVLGSTSQLDICGKCGGDNRSCEIISGQYNTSHYGYNRVVRIPSGSSNIDIRQNGYQGSNKDDNYLALVDAETGDYILNGNFIVSMFRKLILFGGTTLEYTGSDAVMERLNSSRPLKKDLIVEVLSVGVLYPPDIQYQYTILRSSAGQFRWEVRAQWSICNRVCNGQRHRKAVCVQLPGREEVSEKHCNYYPQPKTEIETCNTHCTLKWNVAHKSECSSHCGKGTRTLTVQCLQEFPDSQAIVIHNSSCRHLHYRPPDIEACEGPCDRAHWKFGMWSDCSQTCGGGVQTRTAECVDELNRSMQESDCDPNERVIDRLCGTQKCPQWEVGEWTPCSVTCGIGERHRPYWCQLDNRVVAADFCPHEKQPRHKELCESMPCATWHVGEWQECSVSCGTGKSLRAVGCRSAEGSMLNDSACADMEKPTQAQACIKPCLKEPQTIIPSTSTTSSVTTGTTTILPNENAVHRKYTLPTKVPPTYESENMIPKSGDDHDVWTKSSSPGQKSAKIIDQPPRAVWKVLGWGECSVTCGEGIRKRTVMCYDQSKSTAVDRKYCSSSEPVLTDVCLREPCGRWITGDWQPCTVTCGKGWSVREVKCVSVSSNLPLADGACAISERPDSEKLCRSAECIHSSQQVADTEHVGSNEAIFHWRTGPWGKCSKTCGGGYKIRQVVCKDNEDREGDQCDLETQPVEYVHCNNDPCPTWNFGAWGMCNKSCGGGYQHRQVRCQDHLGVILPDHQCAIAERPHHVQECNPHRCPSGSRSQRYRWKTSNWGQCTKTCGKGFRYRTVTCIEETKPEEEVDDSLCDIHEKPRAMRGCNRTPCPYMWVEDAWSECSHTCGSGVQHRKVTCHRVNRYGWIDPEPVSRGCNITERPSEIQPCNLGECNAAYYWKAGPWKDCSQPCGKKGRQRRHLYCYHKGGKKAPRNNCPKEFKPSRKRKCNQKRCGYFSCNDVQERLLVHEDKEYILQLAGKNVSIYCHDMNTTSPKEYLTLPEGERENYSEIYDRRLINPDTCPYNAERRDNCECVQDKQRAGLTLFNKVRLNVTSLRVNTQDFTFSRQMKGQRIAYGEAGDCYSSSNCPQGRFSINLVGTGLQVSSYTSWVGHGNRASLWISRLEDNQKVVGKCGGYCGNCTPQLHIGLKLDVLPP